MGSLNVAEPKKECSGVILVVPGIPKVQVVTATISVPNPVTCSSVWDAKRALCVPCKASNCISCLGTSLRNARYKELLGGFQKREPPPV